MKITVKNLEQQSFVYELDPNMTIKQLKEKFGQDAGAEYPSENVKLIYAGEILQDDMPLSECGIDDDKKFIVAVVFKTQEQLREAEKKVIEQRRFPYE